MNDYKIEGALKDLLEVVENTSKLLDLSQDAYRDGELMAADLIASHAQTVATMGIIGALTQILLALVDPNIGDVSVHGRSEIFARAAWQPWPEEETERGDE